MESGFVLLVDGIRNPGEEDLHGLAQLLQIAVQQRSGDLGGEFHHPGLRLARVTVEDVGAERSRDLPVGKVEKIPRLPELLFGGFDRPAPLSCDDIINTMIGAFSAGVAATIAVFKLFSGW